MFNGQCISKKKISDLLLFSDVRGELTLDSRRTKMASADISVLHKKALETLEKKLKFTKLGDNGICQVYDAKIPPRGYITVGYFHPTEACWTTTTTGRAVVMVKKEGSIFLDSAREASHLCHNKTCVLSEHIVFEPPSINTDRKRCARRKVCMGHGPNHPDCLVHYKMKKQPVSPKLKLGGLDAERMFVDLVLLKA